MAIQLTAPIGACFLTEGGERVPLVDWPLATRVNTFAELGEEYLCVEGWIEARLLPPGTLRIGTVGCLELHLDVGRVRTGTLVLSAYETRDWGLLRWHVTSDPRQIAYW